MLLAAPSIDALDNPFISAALGIVVLTLVMTVAVMAASHALAGRQEEAERAMTHLRELDPTLRISSLADWLSIRRPKDLATLADGLRKAGLPD